MGVAIVMVTIVAGGVAIVLMAMYQRSKATEMQHRERMAMIERGLAPPPEVDPARFDATSGGSAAAPSRFTSLGVAIVGLGLALMLLIAFAGDAPGPAVGVGGATVVLGLAFIVNGYLRRSS